MVKPPDKTLRGHRSLCRECGEYFGGTWMFARHRTGTFGTIQKPGTRRCLTVAEMKRRGWHLRPDGFWVASRPGEGVLRRLHNEEE